MTEHYIELHAISAFSFLQGRVVAGDVDFSRARVGVSRDGVIRPQWHVWRGAIPSCGEAKRYSCSCGKRDRRAGAWSSADAPRMGSTSVSDGASAASAAVRISYWLSEPLSPGYSSQDARSFEG